MTEQTYVNQDTYKMRNAQMYHIGIVGG